MPRQITRTSFLVAALAASVAPPALADAPADADLASARLLVAVELLLGDFYDRVLKADLFGAAARNAFARARFNEREHLAAVSRVLTDAGQIPATTGDIDFSYPAGAFSSRGRTARTGAKLERLALGAYLGAVQSAQSSAIAFQLALIASCEARHLTVFEAEATGHALDESFGEPLAIDVASDKLAAYTG